MLELVLSVGGCLMVFLSSNLVFAVRPILCLGCWCLGWHRHFTDRFGRMLLFLEEVSRCIQYEFGGWRFIPIFDTSRFVRRQVTVNFLSFNWFWLRLLDDYRRCLNVHFSREGFNFRSCDFRLNLVTFLHNNFFKLHR